MRNQWSLSKSLVSKVLTVLSVSAPLSAFALFGIGQSPVKASERPVVQSLQEVTAKTDETSKLLSDAMMSQGSFQSITPEQIESVRSVLDSIAAPREGQELPIMLAKGGFNGTGGGGGLVCFKSPAEADGALDKAGRLDRKKIEKIIDFENFDTFRIIRRDERRWKDATKKNLHLIYPRPGESAEFFLRRVLHRNMLAFFPLLVERLEAFMIRYPFSSWQPATGKGLPLYPDLDDDLYKNQRTSANPCIYVQLAIRMQEMPAKKVFFLYDKELLDHVRKISPSEVVYQHRLAVLILHEAAYFLAREVGAKNANEIYKILEAALFDDANIDDIKNSFYQPGEPSLDYVNQSIGLLFEEPYKALLAKEPSIAPWPSKLELFNAWIKMVKFERTALEEQARSGCKGSQCMAGGGALTRYIFEHPKIASELTPAEAYFVYAPSFSYYNSIPSPEALVSRSVDPRGALNYSCKQIDFEKKTFTMHAADGKQSMELSASVGRELFAKMKEFCKPAL